MKAGSYEPQLARQSGLRRIFKINKPQLAKRLPAGAGPASSLAFESLQKSCDMYDLRWPHRDRESISEGEAVKGVFLVTCI